MGTSFLFFFFVPLRRSIHTQDLKTHCLFVLQGMCDPEDKSRQMSVVTTLRVSANHGVLATTLRQTITAMLETPTGVGNVNTLFIETLLSLIQVIVSAQPGRSMLVSGGVILDLVPILAAKNPRHIRVRGPFYPAFIYLPHTTSSCPRPSKRSS